jgi:hypothetical protein
MWEIGQKTNLSSFVQQFHHGTNLIALFFRTLKDNYEVRITKFEVLEVFPIQIPTYNGKMKILFIEFHHRTNLISYQITQQRCRSLLSKLGSKNTTTNLEF